MCGGLCFKPPMDTHVDRCGLLSLVDNGWKEKHTKFNTWKVHPMFSMCLPVLYILLGLTSI
jgi:hypothetical protein